MSSDHECSRMKRRIRLKNQMEWMEAHNSLAFKKHKQRLNDGKKLQDLLQGLKKADNPREELAANIMFASNKPENSVLLLVS